MSKINTAKESDSIFEMLFYAVYPYLVQCAKQKTNLN